MNKFEKRSMESYNRKAENYENTADGKFTVEFKNVLLKSIHIPENSVLCDIACGNGRLLKMLTEKGQFQGSGVDISEKMIVQAKILNPNMNFYVTGCEALPFANDSMDIMTVCAAFHHFPNVEHFAKEAKRTIKKDGKLYIAEIYLPRVLRVMCNPFVKFSKSGDVRFYSPKEITDLFEKNGFSVEEVSVEGRIQLIVLKKIY